MDKILHIKTPYKVAGWKYGWNKDGYKQIGVGINMKLLEGDGYIDMTIDDSKYMWRLDKSIARNFIDKYKSYYQTEFGPLLGVVSWDEKIFTKLENVFVGN